MTARVNKTDQAYQVLEKMITSQELAPGSLLSERALMERTGYGRTPVREALQRLARDRMVDIHPNRGVFVADASVESQLRLLEVRRSLAELAVRLAAHRADQGQKDAMLEIAEQLERLDRDDIHVFGPLLQQSHALIEAAARNDFLSVAMAPLEGLSRRFWSANLRGRAQDLRAWVDRHCAVLRAVHQGDADQAAQASRQLNDYFVELAHRTLRDR